MPTEGEEDVVQSAFPLLTGQLARGTTEVLVQSQPRMSENKLYLAAKRGQSSLVESYLRQGADPRRVAPSGETPLHAAASRGNPKMIQNLLMKGADADARDNAGNTPLHSACDSGKFANVKILLKSGANSNASNEQGVTPLHVACSRNMLHIVKTLLKNGADREIQDQHGQTPLHIASKFTEKDTAAKYLLKLGTDITIQDKFGNTPFHLACKYKNENLVPIYLVLGADINQRNNHGILPMQNAFKTLPFEYDRLKSIRMVQIFYTNFTKMAALNLEIGRENMILIEEYMKGLFSAENVLYMTQSFRRECDIEVDKMREYRLKNNITLLDFICADINKVCVWFKNEELVEEIGNLNFRREFPVYSQELVYQYERGLERRGLLRWAVAGWYGVFPRRLTAAGLRGCPLACLPSELVEQILGYLGNRELRLFCREVQAPVHFQFSI